MRTRYRPFARFRAVGGPCADSPSSPKRAAPGTLCLRLSHGCATRSRRRSAVDTAALPDYKPRSQAVVAGSAQVAQLVEQATENRCVGGSIPPLGTMNFLRRCAKHLRTGAVPLALYTQLVPLFEQQIAQLTSALKRPDQTCSLYQLPACINGTLVPLVADAKGCDLPPKCVLKKSVPDQCPSHSLPTCNGAIAGQGTDANGCRLPRRCAPTAPTISFTTSPTAGAGTLAVRFSRKAAALGINDSMDFGDGQPDNWLDGLPSGMSHTYVSAVIYTARLNDTSGTTIGNITVTVAQNAPPCLQYQIPNCAGGQHVQSGPVDSNGCIGAPMCIQDSSPTFTASPKSGQAPLGVQFYATIGNQYSIDFGDGQTGSLTSPCMGTANAPKGACPPPGAYHTYAGPGTYSATLRLLTSCPQKTACDLPVGTVTITVTDGRAPKRN